MESWRQFINNFHATAQIKMEESIWTLDDKTVGISLEKVSILYILRVVYICYVFSLEFE